MTLIKYIENAHESDITGSIRVSGGTLVLGGPAVDVTDLELQRIAALGIQFERVADDAAPVVAEAPAQAPVSPVPSFPSSAVAPIPQAPVTGPLSSSSDE